jgi:uncharacterized repeat protein (TIGR03803 family)
MKTKTTFLKIATLAIFSFFFSLQIHAQVMLYGLTYGGGTYNQGTIFSINPEGDYETFANLNPTFAALPEGSLLHASNGNFYGSSFCGGYDDSCTIWCCSPYGIVSTSINLDSVWGFSDPEGNGLIQAMDGSLYGLSTLGGNSGAGLIFKLELSGQYSEVHFFNGTDGDAPYGSLIQTPDGTLWGMTSSGGASGAGNIFNCSTSGTFNSVYSFTSGVDGGNPHGDLLLANDGNFYGMTYSGGKYNYGTVFKYSTSTGYTKLADFNDTNGAYPYGSIMQATDGNLYGLTSKGGILQTAGGYGTLFECSLSGHLTTLVQFNDSANGATPYGSLMQASDGNIYGMTYAGGKYGVGTIFQYSLSRVFTKLFDFSGTTGHNPMYGKMSEVDDISTSINNITKTGNAMLYPNPNNGQFALKLSGISSESVIEVYTELGEKVYSENLPSNLSFHSINIGSQPNGVYLYRITDGNGNNFSNGRFVIQK